MSEDPIITPEPPKNPLLAGFDKIPGMSIPLPSKCVLYTTEVNDQALSSGEVHIRPMGLKHEMALKTPDLLINGQGIEGVLNDCIDEVNNVNQLFACDVNALLVALRISTFGEMMSVKVHNPYYDANNEKSQKTFTYEVDLRTCFHQGCSVESKEDFSIKLDNGQVVVLKPLTFEDSINMIKLEVESSGVELTTDEQRAEFLKDKVHQITNNALRMIVSVSTIDGVVITDIPNIRDWYEKIPPLAFKPLKEKIDFIGKLGPDLTFDARDPLTENVWKSKIPINPTDFFGTGSVSANRTS